MPPREDLRRYSRDYYVGGSTSKTALRGRNSNLNYPKHPQNQSPASNQHQLTNGHHSLCSTSQQVTRNGQEIRIAVGSHNTTSHRGENLKDSRANPETGTESPEVIESCRAGDWKDELKDIQAARVEQEVARLQRTIEETQRRWETYARHAPGRGTPVLSDGSIEHLHHPRPEAYLVPPRHDLWRTVSEDTISVPLKEAPSKQPLLRHISMDNLRPATKVSNIHPLAHHPHQSTTSINSVGSSLDGPGHPSSYSPPAHLGRSVESVGGYSDRDALDSDGSLHTPEESLALPSVRKLASRFDSGPQKVNNLDKHGKSNSLTYSGKNIQSGGRNTQGDRAAFTNNLNKSTEKPYIMKEVRSLAEVQAPTDPDSHSSDDDHSVFDDAATVTSMSLPPTPVSLSNQHSYSTSSLIDTDSSHFDSRDPDTSGSRTFFGVTLRRANRSSPVHVYSKKRDSVSDEASQADPRDLAARRLSNRSTVSLGRAPTPSSSEEDTPATLRQSTIIKVDAKPRSSFSNTWNLAPLKSSARSQSLANLHTSEDQSSGNFPMTQKNMGSAVGYAFAPKGKRSMSSFLKAYSRQKSLHDIHQIDEKSEENFSNQKTVDNQYQQRLQNQWTQPASLPSTLRKAKSEKSFRNIDYESEITVNTNTFINKKTQLSVHQSTTVNGHTFEGELLKSTSKTSAPKGFVEPCVAGMTIPSQGSFSDDKETPAMKKSVPQEGNDSSDEDENSSHSSRDDVAPVAATMVNCTGDDPSEIVLNMAHVSAFQEHLKMEASPSPSDGTQLSEVTGGGTMRRHKSVGDLLKEYSNIKSLDRKKDVVSNVSLQKAATTENTEPYKTVIDVQHSSTQGSSTVPYSSHTKTQSLKKAKPKTTPAPMKKSLSHSYFKHVDQKAENTHTVNSGLEGKSPDDYDGRVFHASTIYVGDDGSDSHPDYSARITVNGQTSPPVKREVTVNQCYISIPTEPQNALPAGSLDAMTTEKHKKEQDKHDPINTTVEVNRTFVTVKDKEISSSSHISVISVIEKDDVNSSSEEETEKINPKAIKEMIMRESRTGKSGGISAKALARQQKIMDASVPLNSPFSPLRSQPRKKSSSSLSPSEEAPPKLRSQDSQDEGVGFPSDTPPSANSQDPAEHEGGQPRV